MSLFQIGLMFFKKERERERERKAKVTRKNCSSVFFLFENKNTKKEKKMFDILCIRYRYFISWMSPFVNFWINIIVLLVN